MIDINHLNEEIYEIEEQTKMISFAVNNRTIGDTNILNKLLLIYIQKVNKHLNEENNLYEALENKLSQNVNRFLSRLDEIKLSEALYHFLLELDKIRRVFKQYQNRWRRNDKLCVKNNRKFLQNSNDIFEIVLYWEMDFSERINKIRGLI